MEEKEEELCSICNDVFKHKTSTFVCSHNFCQTCIVQWNVECRRRGVPVTCPVCRKIDNIWGK